MKGCFLSRSAQGEHTNTHTHAVSDQLANQQRVLKTLGSQRELCEVMIMPAVSYLLRAVARLMDVFYLHLRDEEK